MREYEIVYIFRPELESEAVDAKLEEYHGRLDGEVTAVEHWGTRQLAFEIDGERSGYYVVAQYRADPGSLEGFEQGFKHDEEVIRHLVVLAEGELPAPPSERDTSDGEGDEAGEDEDGEEEGEDEDEDTADEEGDGDDEGDDTGDEGDDSADEGDDSADDGDDGDDEGEEE